mmetsp:Transcript_85065/g.214389  ORF Transcript_85065/g.214389 Transcript_85065/m.214389 type:complete len:222 (-) Transcript_85065:788-1453(-)
MTPSVLLASQELKVRRISTNSALGILHWSTKSSFRSINLMTPIWFLSSARKALRTQTHSSRDKVQAINRMHALWKREAWVKLTKLLTPCLRPPQGETLQQFSAAGRARCSFNHGWLKASAAVQRCPTPPPSPAAPPAADSNRWTKSAPLGEIPLAGDTPSTVLSVSGGIGGAIGGCCFPASGMPPRRGGGWPVRREEAITPKLLRSRDTALSHEPGLPEDL